MNQPQLDEAQWRVIYDLLEQSTPIGAKFATDKEELAWYRRSAILLSIKSTFGWRSRSKRSDNGNQPELPEAEG